jgi:environmental stress-induced protein Ves
MIEVIDPAAYRRERWKNGQGWTCEIARGSIVAPSCQTAIGDAAHEWDWRLSIATIESDGPFSTFPGIDRTLVLLDGRGMRLDLDDGTQVQLERRGDRIDFAGERTLRSVLHDGPTRDFNAMWKRSRVHAQVTAPMVTGALSVAIAGDDVCAIHVIDGNLLVRTIAAGDQGGARVGSRSAAAANGDDARSRARSNGDDAHPADRATNAPRAHGDGDRTFAVSAGHTLLDRGHGDRILDASGRATAIIARFCARLDR